MPIEFDLFFFTSFYKNDYDDRFYSCLVDKVFISSRYFNDRPTESQRLVKKSSEKYKLYLSTINRIVTSISWKEVKKYYTNWAKVYIPTLLSLFLLWLHVKYCSILGLYISEIRLWRRNFISRGPSAPVLVLGQSPKNK